MENEIKKIRREGTRPTLVLHSCCAPCSSACLEQLNEHFRLVVFYYNPNISPESEFVHRAEEQKRLIGQMLLAEDIETSIGQYDPQNFYEKVRGHEADPEGGDRCGICFEMRLRATAEAARAGGSSSIRMIMKHIIPNSIGVIIVNTTLNVAKIIIYESTLSFLGLGMKPPAPEWGAMLSEAREFMRTAPHLLIFPALAIVLTASAINLLGDGLRDALDPHLRS
jgi:hypothetical protein